jgi:hypothetical protein
LKDSRRPGLDYTGVFVNLLVVVEPLLSHFLVTVQFLFRHPIEFERPKYRVLHEILKFIALNILYDGNRTPVCFLSAGCRVRPGTLEAVLWQEMTAFSLAVNMNDDPKREASNFKVFAIPSLAGFAMTLRGIVS